MSRLKTLSMMINHHLINQNLKENEFSMMINNLLLEIEKENEELKERIVLLEVAQNKLMNWWAEELKRRTSE